jgi:serine protease Do
VNLIKAVLPTLLKGGKIARGQLGVVIQDISPELAQHFRLTATKGVLVAQVNSGSAASKGGMKTGDVITRFDGMEIQDTHDLRNRVAATKPGSQVTVDIIREGKPQTLSVTLEGTAKEPATAPNAGAASNQLAKLGLTVQDPTPALMRQYGVADGQGIIITKVEEGSSADLGGLQEGDLIAQVNHEPVSNVGTLQHALDMIKGKGSILLLIKRKDASLYVVLPVS